MTGELLEAAEEEEERLSGEVEEGQEEVDRSDGELAEVAIAAYKGGGPPSPATVYVGGQEPQDTVDRSMNYRSEEHTSELQSRGHLVCRLLLEKKKIRICLKVDSLSLTCSKKVMLQMHT